MTSTGGIQAVALFANGNLVIPVVYHSTAAMRVSQVVVVSIMREIWTVDDTNTGSCMRDVHPNAWRVGLMISRAFRAEKFRMFPACLVAHW